MSTKVLLCLVSITLLVSTSAFAVDGVVLINQASVMTAGGFPYQITKSGSYRLAGNLTVDQFGVDGIDIIADDVTLDLNGFSILGPTCSNVILCGELLPGDGISSANRDITVKDGTVKFMNNGVNLSGVNAFVEEIRATNSQADGIRVGSFDLDSPSLSNIVRRCIAASNVGIGIETFGALVEGNVATDNHSFGISVFFGGTVLSNMTNGNSFGLRCEACLVGSNRFGDGIDGFLFSISQMNNNCGGQLC